MKIVTYLGMLTSTAGLLSLCYFDPSPSSAWLWIDVTSLSVLFSVHRVQVKTGASLLLPPGWTIYRANGKVRLRRKVDYKKIEALEKELRLGEWSYEVEAPKSHASAGQFYPGGMKPLRKAKIEKSKRPHNDFDSIHRHIMDDIAAAYRVNPMLIGRERSNRFTSIHPMDEPYPVMVPTRCLCNYAGCITCNPPVPA